jgi:beta-glucosidase
MSLDEKAGMLLIDTLNAPAPGEGIDSTAAAGLVGDEKMTRFVFRNVVTSDPAPQRAASLGEPGGPGAPRGTLDRLGPGRPGGNPFASSPVTPRQAAEFTNAVQELAERTRLGIPVVFKSNARNHYERQARGGINEAAGSMSEWPKEAGLAATRDMALIRTFAETMGQEWRAIGLRGMYGYMADLSTDPRWYRVHETFTEDADLCAEIMKVLVEGLQGGPVTPATNVAMTDQALPGRRPAGVGARPALHVRQAAGVPHAAASSGT